MIPPPDHEQRLLATDERRSVIVQAPAGSGKTSLLVARYLRLLSMANHPEEVLAITFTRKAAGEMRARVIHALTARADAARGALDRSERLGWNLPQQPNRLKIQTIDSFAMTLLRQMPLSADFDPHASLVEEAQELYLAAADRLFNRLYEDDPLAPYVADFLAWLGNDQQRANSLLAAMLGRRDQWQDVVSEVVRTHTDASDRVPAVLGSGVEILNAKLVAELRSHLSASCYQELEDVAGQAAAHLNREILSPRERYRYMGEALTTQKDRLRKTLTKTEGFPLSDPELKRRGLTLLEELATHGHEPLIANLRYMPESSTHGDQLDTLITLCVTLTLAVVELNRIFAARKVADFTQLILSARTLLNDGDAPTELALALDYRIRHLLVDEFQDTSISQFRMFEQLVQGWEVNDGNTFFAVGDPMQSIYRFRDADVSLFFDAWGSGIGGVALERIRLSANFRAQAGLVRWINQAFDQVLGSTQDPLLGRVAYSPAVAARESADDPAMAVDLYDTEAQEIQAVVERVQRLLAADPSTRIAVLVRGRPHLRGLLPALRDAEVTWRATDIEPLLERPAVQDLLSLARAIADPCDRLAWFSVLRTPWIGLSLPDLEQFSTCEQLPQAIAQLPEALTADGRRRIERLNAALALGARLLDEAPPRAVLETVFIAAGGADAYPDGADLDSAERLFELVDSLGADGLDPRILERAASGLYAVDNADTRLEILTIHKAKGLEFDHVILPFLDRLTTRSDAPLLRWRMQAPGLLMGAKDGGSVYEWLAREDRARERHELERLLYVACTRARQGLHLFARAHERAPSGSLLGMLWPTLDEDDRVPRTLLSRRDVLPVQKDLFTERATTRLRADYEWQPPARAALSIAGELTVNAAADQLDRRWQVALGTLMHETLFTLSQSALPEDVGAFVDARHARWRTRLVELQVDPAERDSTLAELERQVRLVLADAQGRWLLSARQGARSEAALTGLGDDGLVNMFLDRTFVDEEGVRWIVDYKSVMADRTRGSEFIARETARYLPQLRRYAEFAGAAFDEPLRAAIYFTALPHLEVLDQVG